jgi:hypothetical protein
MNEPRMPGFTAEFSVYKTPWHYRGTASSANRIVGQDVQALFPSACPPGLECGPPDVGTCCPPNRPSCCVDSSNPFSPYDCCPSNDPDCCQGTGGGGSTGPCPNRAPLCGQWCCPPGTTCGDTLRGVCCRDDERACHTELNTECCSRDLACTPKGGCCAANNVCGDDCCPPERCLNGICCRGTISEGHCCPPEFAWASADRPPRCCPGGWPISQGHCCRPGEAWDSAHNACCPGGNCCGPGTVRAPNGECCPLGTRFCKKGGCCGPVKPNIFTAPSGYRRCISDETTCCPVEAVCDDKCCGIPNEWPHYDPTTHTCSCY